MIPAQSLLLALLQASVLLALAPLLRGVIKTMKAAFQTRQGPPLLQGYYELEVGSSGQTIWVPVSGVVPES